MWSLETNPLDQTVVGVCWADDLAEFLAVGQDSGDTEALIRSADGTSWIFQASPFDGTLPKGAVRDLFHGTTIVAGRTSDAVDAFITSPDNSTWTARGNPFVGPGYGFGCAVRESDGALLAAGGTFGNGRFAVSLDDGATWTRFDPFGSPLAIGNCVAVRAADDLILAAGRPYDIYYYAASDYAATSADGGATWTTTRPFGDGGQINGCSVRDSDGALVVAGQNGSGQAIIGVSTDDGATWTTHQPFGAIVSFAQGVTVRQSDGALLVAGFDDGVSTVQFAISTDDGTTWITGVPFGAGGNGNGVTVRTSDDAILVTGADNGNTVQLAISTDSGTTWTTVGSIRLQVGRGVAVRDSDDLILLAGDSGEATSADGGATWTTRYSFSDGRGGGAAIRQADGELLVAGYDVAGSVQAAVSTDDGATWETSAPFSIPIGTALCIACKQANGALVAGADFGEGVIATSGDGGVTWEAVPSPFDGGGAVYSIAYSVADDAWLALGLDSSSAALAALSTDDGATWGALVSQPPMAYNFNSFYPLVYRDEPNAAWWTLGQTVGFHAAAVATAPLLVVIPVGNSPYSVAFTPDGTTAYVANGSDNTVTPIDIATRTPGAPIAVGSNPQSLAVSPDGTTVYVANLNDSTVTPIDVATGIPGAPIAVGGGPYSVAFTPDGATAYVCNNYDATVTPIDVATATPGAPIAVGSSPDAVAVTPDGTTAYVANGGDATVTPIDVATSTPDATIAVGSGPYAVAFTPDSATAYVVNQNDGTVTPIDVATATPAAPITVGSSPYAVAISPDGATALVANFSDNTLTSIDIATSTPSSPIRVGLEPSAVAYSPDGSVAYVCNYGDNSVTPYTGSDPWTEVTTPLDDPALTGGAFAMVNAGGPLALVGNDSSNAKQMAVSVDGGGTWAFDVTPSPFGDGGGDLAYALAYSPALDLAVAGGSGIGTVASGLPSGLDPIVTDSPVTVAGTPALGVPLVATPGVYTPTPTSRSYQWQRCDAGGGSCADIGGETSISYTPGPGDVGNTLRVVETVSKVGFSDGGSMSDPPLLLPLVYGAWTDAASPWDGNEARSVCWDPDNELFVAVGGVIEAVLTSPDAANWDSQATPLDGEGYGVARSTPNGVTVVVGADNSGHSQAIVTSPDDLAWTDRGNPFLSFGAAYGVAIRDSDDAILLAGADWASGANANLAISTDTGATWSLIRAGDAFLTCHDVAVRASDDLLLVVGEGSGGSKTAAVSTDGGATWPALGRTNPLGSGGICYGCAVRDSDGALVVVGVSGAGVATLAISTDDGATWTTHQPFGASAGSHTFGVGVNGGTIAVVGYDAGHTEQFAYSTDGGTTWTTRTPFGSGGSAFALIFHGGSIFVAGNDTFGNMQLALTSNLGVSWGTSQPFGPFGGSAKGVAKSSSFFSYILSGTDGVGDQASINSDPSLSSWTQTSPFGAGRIGGSVVVRASDGVVVVVGGSGEPTQVAISTDNAATWTAYGPFNLPSGQGSAVGCNQSSGVVVAGAVSSDLVLARSTDGLAYVAMDSPFTRGGVAGIDYSPSEGRWMVSGRDSGGAATVAYSDDDGLTWTVIGTHPMDASFAAPTVYRDEENGNWYLLGQTTGGNALAISGNSGATWTEIPTPLDPVAGVGQANTMVNCGGTFALGGYDATGQFQMCASADGLSWGRDLGNDAPFGSDTTGIAYGLAYSPSLDVAVVVGVT